MPVLPHVHAVTSSAALIHHLSALDGSSSTRSTISSVTGSVSFFVWLFAQSPQIYKNYQRKSVEGLSLVFLFQWIAGDVLNLIGCILTRQLAFQVAVATWFVLVDVVLTAQVVLYGKNSPEGSSVTRRRSRHHRHGRDQHQHQHTHYVHPHSHSHSHSRHTERIRPIDEWYYDRARSVAGGGSNSRHAHRRSQSYSAHGEGTRAAAAIEEGVGTTGHGRRLDMSASANLEHLRGPRRPTPDHSRSSSRRRTATPAIAALSRLSDDDDGSGDGDGGQHGSARGRGRSSASASTSSSASTSRSASASRAPQPAPARGRQAQRRARDGGTTDGVIYVRPDVSRSSSSASSYRQMTEEAIRVLRIVERLESRGGSGGGSKGWDERDRGRRKSTKAIRGGGGGDVGGNDDDDHEISSTSTSTPRATARQSSRTGLLNPRSATSSRNSSTSRSAAIKRHPALDAVLVEEGFAVAGANDSDVTIREAATTATAGVQGGTRRTWLRVGGVAFVCVMVVAAALTAFALFARRGGPVMTLLAGPEKPPPAPSPTPAPPHHPPSSPSSPSIQIVGRLSSWLCTILYVTSRLPQIWENQTRRSCEGISILLFIAAFLGNLFYAISILTNPESGQWLGRHGEDELPLPDDPWAAAAKAAFFASSSSSSPPQPPLASDEDARRYLMESMPFLLGSAGTLLFDAVVLVQWWAFAEEQTGEAGQGGVGGSSGKRRHRGSRRRGGGGGNDGEDDELHSAVSETTPLLLSVPASAPAAAATAEEEEELTSTAVSPSSDPIPA